MGGFWTSVTVRAPAREAVVAVLRRMGRTAFVGPDERGWIVVFDRACESQDDGEAVALGAELSRAFAGSALVARVQDGEALATWLFDRGYLLDRYDSWPGHFSGAPPVPHGGDADTLCAVLGVPDAAPEVRQLLHGPCDRSDGLFLHDALVNALGLPETSVGLGYGHLASGERPGGEIAAEDDPFVHVTPLRRRSGRGQEPPSQRPDRAIAEVAVRVAAEPLALGAFLETTQDELAAATHASDAARRHRLINHLSCHQLPVLREVLQHCTPGEERESLQRFLARAEETLRSA